MWISYDVHYSTAYLIPFAGYQSYVGKEICVHKPEVTIELQYQECCTNGEDEPMRGAFTPWMFINLVVINEYQYQKLLSPDVHFSFDAKDFVLHKVLSYLIISISEIM